MIIKRIFLILNIYIICLSNSSHCVKLKKCKIKNLNFIYSKSYYPYKIASKNNINRNNSVKTNLYSKVSHYTGTKKKSKFAVDFPQPNDETLGKLFYIDKSGFFKFRDPIKAAIDSLIPDILRVYQTRYDLGYGPVPSLLCCSGGVDSMSLLHSLGLIKNNYEFLVHHDYISPITFSTHPYNITNNTEAVTKDDRKSHFLNSRNDILKMFKDFFENFNVIYFNHKQREDVDVDIKVIKDACQQYGFNLIVRELQLTDEMKEEGKNSGLQNTFRMWRREACTNILDGLSSSLESIRMNKMYNNNNTTSNNDNNYNTNSNNSNGSTSGNNNNYYYNSNNNNSYNQPELVLDEIFDGELQSIKSLKDLADLKGFVFMGHNLDDNFETVLLKLIRGTYLSNMTPMELYNDLDQNNYLLIRPFIHLKKSSLKTFIDDINGTFNEDSSNSKMNYTRNILRNAVLPRMISSMSNDKSEENKNKEPEFQKMDESESDVENENEKENKNEKIKKDTESKTTKDKNTREILVGLDKKLKYMSKQCKSFNELIKNEVEMFFDYLDYKYNNNMYNNNNSNNMYSSTSDTASPTNITNNINSNTNVTDLSNITADKNYNQEKWDGWEEYKNNELKKVYRNFYENLYQITYKDRLNNFEVQFNNAFNHLRKIGLKMDGYFNLKDWIIIPNLLIKEQVINKFIFDKLGKHVDYKKLHELVKMLTKQPFTHQIKMYSVGRYLINHQGYILKIRPNPSIHLPICVHKNTTTTTNTTDRSNKDNTSKDGIHTISIRDNTTERKLVYSDDKVSIYSLLNDVNVEVNPQMISSMNNDRFYMKFKVTPPTNGSTNGTHYYNGNGNNSNGSTSGNGNGSIINYYNKTNNSYNQQNHQEDIENSSMSNDKSEENKIKDNGKSAEKLEFEIRYINEGDIVPFKKMWVNNAYKLLTQIGVNKILKEEVAGIVLAGTNKVIGFYGFNSIPPHYPKGNQVLSYQSSIVNEPLQYNISIY